jgi:hypothetical protein
MYQILVGMTVKTGQKKHIRNILFFFRIVLVSGNILDFRIINLKNNQQHYSK